jgi:putative transposase
VARRARSILQGQTYFVRLRGLPQLTVFEKDELKLAFLAWLRDAAKHYKLNIHAYVILPNQAQLLVTPTADDSLSKTMQSLCRRYTQLFNQSYAHQQSIWAGRYFSQLLEDQATSLEFQRKIELSPLKEHLVGHLEDYAWSSYRIHTGREPNYGLQDLEAFWTLGNTPFERQRSWHNFLSEIT